MNMYLKVMTIMLLMTDLVAFSRLISFVYTGTLYSQKFKDKLTINPGRF